MTKSLQNSWNPASWQSKTAGQQPLYPDQSEVEQVVHTLNSLPPLVTWGEIDALKAQLAEAQRGERFLLQGGDCAESFDECTGEFIANKLKILLQMSLVLTHGLKQRIVRVGRMAGQYAKPRSADVEERDGMVLPSYRGDLINRSPFTEADRRPDPKLMLRGYERAALTLNYVRALVEGGFADLHHPEYWDLAFVNDSPLASEYREIVASIDDALNFMETISGQPIHETSRVAFFTSHEGLHLPYEQAQTHYVEEVGRWYNQSTHFPWIGMRTAELDGAHIEYFRGIANPVAVKVGPKMSLEQLKTLVETLNPENEPGRLTLIHRFGAANIKQLLPEFIKAVRETGIDVLWSADPMHGNTETTQSGIKTRRFDNILSELEDAFRIHSEMDSHLGGVHVELTGENVTECTGGARGLTDKDLERAYRSTVDPRLNYEQALEMAMRIVGRKINSNSRKASNS
ncbi:MAG: 3-deoxy-7-phosphoheptulonate synthase class II [Gammaproteobacteria bacterium]|nr:3-deoxy-7-phosphoheptulonate synthase class II [Gammaproteobacteria bacterium]